MKVILKNPSLAEQIDKELIAAKEQGRTVDYIELTRKELHVLMCNSLAKCIDISTGSYTYKGASITFIIMTDDCGHDLDKSEDARNRKLSKDIHQRFLAALDEDYTKKVDRSLMTDTVKVRGPFYMRHLPNVSLSKEQIIFNLCK